MGSKIDWTIGGGTMLNDMFAHRESKDIDIFVSDPQILLFLTPRSNDVAEQIGDAGSYVESSNFIKFVTRNGEIDFIVAPRLTKPHAIPRDIGDHPAMVETPVEILAKKVLYRAEAFTGRDLFDLAFLIENGEAEKLMQDKSTYLPKLNIILERMLTHPDGPRRAFEQLQTINYHPTFDHCVATVQRFVADHTQAG
jgi:hypothetical protein